MIMSVFKQKVKKIMFNACGNSAKKLLNLLRVLRDKIALAPPPSPPAASNKRFKAAGVSFMLQWAVWEDAMKYWDHSLLALIVCPFM